MPVSAHTAVASQFRKYPKSPQQQYYTEADLALEPEERATQSQQFQEGAIQLSVERDLNVVNQWIYYEPPWPPIIWAS
jgi:hypothetical protein